MKALVKSRAEPGLWLEDVPEPELGINDVKIRVHETGICGTDVHIHRWDGWAQRTIPVPLVVGHEFVGVVADVGSNVSDFRPGDLVGGEGHVVCGRCRNCMAGRRQLCAHSIGLGVQRPGAFAEYVVLPMTNVWHHWPGVSEDVASIFDPFGNAVHTALAFPVLGEDVLVTGAGPIGCMAVAVVRHAGREARRRHRPQPVPARPRAADGRDARGRPAGAGPRRRAARARDDGGLRRRCSRCPATPDALRSGVANMAHGGRIAMLGIPTGEVELDLDPVIFNMLTLKGIYGREMYETWYQMSVMLDSGLDISPVITHRFPYSEFEQAFEVAASGESGKVLLDWKGA